MINKNYVWEIEKNRKIQKLKNYLVLTFEIDQLSPIYVGCYLRSNNYFFHQDLGDQLHDLYSYYILQLRLLFFMPV